MTHCQFCGVLLTEENESGSSFKGEGVCNSEQCNITMFNEMKKMSEDCLHCGKDNDVFRNCKNNLDCNRALILGRIT